MAFVPTPDELARLRSAIALASFREGERILWLLSFACVFTIGVGMLFWGDLPTEAAAAGIIGFLGGFFVLYWRLRAAHLARTAPGDLRDLFTVDLRTREQRAFVALMLRHAFTGNNPLAHRRQHQRSL